MEKIILTTSDNIQIVGDYYPAQVKTAPAVILLHMMPATKESWREFIPHLTEKGFQVLAIDERGHGESTLRLRSGQAPEKLDFRDFTDEEQQAKKLDVLSARKFFENKGVSAEYIFCGGGSIGANLAIQYMAEHPESRAGFALSPGYNYRGIETMPLVRRLISEQAIYIVAARDDARSGGFADEMAQGLYDAAQAKKELKIYETGGHAEDILKTHSDLGEELAVWLRKNASKQS